MDHLHPSAKAVTKRAYESGTDAYRVFRKMLDCGHPPGDWDQLLSQARVTSVRLGSGTAIGAALKQ